MQQQGGSHYGVPPPEIPPTFSSPDYPQVAESPSPLNSRPAPPRPVLPPHQDSIFTDFSAPSIPRTFPEDDPLAPADDPDRTPGAGNRWPRQETLALLKIRSDMDVVFRDASLKGPLWEDVSRKLADLGYTRSAKKCKEKFENVHKYYKRTKEGRAGRQDGKSYRFFTQLEALHTNNSLSTTINSIPSPQNTTLNPTLTSSTPQNQNKISSSSLPSPIESSMPSAPPVSRSQPPPPLPPPPSHPLLEQSTPAAIVGISFSSNTSSSSSSESDGEETEEGGVGGFDRKRKRENLPCGSRKMMAFFDGLMKQMIERQEAMQKRFLETIEKREQDRMIREEAWKRQEMARLNREYELMAQERTMAANRDAAVISFLQKFTGIQVNPISSTTPQDETEQNPISSPHAQVVPALTLQTETNNNQIERHDLLLNQPTSSSEPAAAASEMGDAIMCAGGMDSISPSSSSSRWPKPEVLALIKIRSGLDSRYLESGPKGPLWEEISLAMKRLGYIRNAKRCKEKWENINKYFKKVKESNKKRPEDAKTCPYFHELDALYRKKQIFSSPANPSQQQSEFAITPKIGVSVQSPALITGLAEQENNKSQKIATGMKNNDEIPTSNGTGLSQLFFAGGANRGSSSSAMKKPEDFVRELIGQQNLQHRAGTDETVHSDTINQEYEDEEEDNEDEEEDEDEEDGKLRYEIQFQRQGGGGGGRGGSSTGNVPAASAASSAGSFLAMVQ